jgi:hypothetical protein
MRRCGLSLSSISAEAALVMAGRWSGGKGRRIIDLAADDADGADEADPVGVVPGLIGGPAHQFPDRVMSQQDPPHFLLGQVRGLGAEDPAGRAQVGLDLIQPGFVLVG